MSADTLPSGSRVVVGLSGGVDSSVATWLLREQGYDLQAVFMKNWEEDDSNGRCAAAEDLADAARVCERLAVPLQTVNFSTEYWDRVFEYFLREIKAGRTPNPDVVCNREVKFRAFLDHASKLGAERIVTGHYARIVGSGDRFQLLKANDRQKDQSYFLHLLTQAQLARALFPLGALTKAEVRSLARKADLPTHNKRDSTGICFVGERPFKEFLSRYVPAQPGPIETPEGQALGTHDGLAYYTLGQRHGLGIGGRVGTGGEAWYVAAKNPDRNALTVVQGRGHPLLHARALVASEAHWIAGVPPNLPLNCASKTRYRQPDQPCTVEETGDGTIRVEFEAPQWAVTPGQSVVFYRGDECLGGAVIQGAS